jgi:hypothetical protein
MVRRVKIDTLRDLYDVNVFVDAAINTCGALQNIFVATINASDLYV